jgi:3-hydroxybutyryl-CoA dehydratase
VEILEYKIEELNSGMTDELSVRVTNESIQQFSTLSGDFAPLHTDKEFAIKRGFKATVAHGMLLGAYVSALIGNKLPGRWGVIQSFKMDFRKPLIPPQNIKIIGKITNVSIAVKQVSIEIDIIDEDGLQIANGEVKSIVSATEIQS